MAHIVLTEPCLVSNPMSQHDMTGPCLALNPMGQLDTTHSIMELCLGLRWEGPSLIGFGRIGTAWLVGEV
jgi:hypothetical protein